ncbi:unnamed protein product [Penicillium olsonii]|uniref:Uncharacterized protein n=1 Tax=Penicillium olsonii TaxID=99116 RepID=A0A9W4MUL5_PENOL|nr:unnamed protein product [Penicillium olsonii]CAG8160375.1 unnamed protein product [Penicillium olsonii]CAG8184735.1 unnamed protein product [Penicillium olsonii]
MPNAKPVLPPLQTQTPKSAAYPPHLHNGYMPSPSEFIKKEYPALRSAPLEHSSRIRKGPTSSPSDYIKLEEPDLKTPVEVPPAYKAFLDTLSQKFEKSGTSNSPTSQPASALSGSFIFSDSLRSPDSVDLRSPTVSLPPATPASAAPYRKRFPPPCRLRTQHLSILSPGVDSPRSATPRSATILRSPFSPDWKLRYYEAPHSATGKPVSVREIVTRTVTYKRTQLEAPPKGKRRKCREAKEVE